MTNKVLNLRSSAPSADPRFQAFFCCAPPPYPQDAPSATRHGVIPFDNLMATLRTSHTHPLEIAQVQANPAHGRIGITFCPGKHDRFAHTGAWARDLGLDLGAIQSWGAKLVLTLVEPAELKALGVPHLGQDVQSRGIAWRHLPIADYAIPSDDFERQWIATGREIRDLLRGGHDVLVHCKGGLGRAGMIAARLLAELRMDPDQAIAAVRRARKGAIETPSQLAVVRRTRPALDAQPNDGGGDAPIDTTLMKQIGGSLGTNLGGVFEDGRGRRYYVKTLESPAHARNERIAAALYRLAGAPTLTYVRTYADDQIATEWIELDKRCVARLSDDERRQAQRWLGVHAWTANWDAAGYHGDNQGVAGGTVLTLDVGGALAFRAQGAPKGKAFAAQVGELDLLRHDHGNPHAVQLFGDMSAEAVAQAIETVVRIPDELIRRVIAEGGGSKQLAEKMVARKGDMERRIRGGIADEAGMANA